jgi:hypothetical protein
MENTPHFEGQSNTGAAEVNIVYKSVKPVTTDFRTGGNEDLYDYVKEYADAHTNGRLSKAIIDIVRDHKNKDISRAIITIQGNSVMSVS